MIRGSIAVSEDLKSSKLVKELNRDVMSITESNLVEASAVLLSDSDLRNEKLEEVVEKGWDAPIFAVTDQEVTDHHLTGVATADPTQATFYAHVINRACDEYDHKVLPPFFDALTDYYNNGYAAFDCPGHQGGQFFRKHPAGRRFYNFYGEDFFQTDLCNADVAMGDLLIHDGAPAEATKLAAKVFNADNTWYILNGTSSSNKVVLNAILTPGDLVLFDRNNHKSVHHGALMMAQAKPVYLETSRNAYGLIGGIGSHCFEESYLRERIAKVDPSKKDSERPFRLAVIQLGTYDGTIYNARQVVDRIGHLCDYILFDSAWVGYEQWIDFMEQCSPLKLELGPDDPGIIVTQSVHKQQAGLSQASQIHKKDSHIEGQDRYVNFDRFNNAYMMHASTSPYYPMFASLDINTKMHANGGGQRLWHEALKIAIEVRKAILRSCTMIRPFVAPEVNGVKWEEIPNEEIMSDRKYFSFGPDDPWHGFAHYEDGQYFVDPMKLLLTTPGLKNKTGGFEYEEFGIPANILAAYLRSQEIIPEKNDLNSILFLLTPSENISKLSNLVVALERFEKLIDSDSPMEDVLPDQFRENSRRYDGYTIRQLCQEMHDFYRSHTVAQLQTDMFREECFPEVVVSAADANYAFARGEVDYIPLSEAEGRVAAEGALPYPPGIICVVPGERWSGRQLKYFQALEEGINLFPGFAPELQGVHIKDMQDGSKKAFCYVLRNSAEK